MDLGWLQSILYGLLSGLAEIMPVSARAHNILLLKIFGENSQGVLLLLLIHLNVLAATYYSYKNQIVRISRALRLASIPKKRRKRPLDMKSLLDYRIWRMTIIPVIIAFFFYRRVSFLESSLVWVSILTFVNGIIMYIPQFLPAGNKDSRTFSPLEGLLIGISGALSVFPGLSGIGAALSIGAVRGGDRKYTLDLVLLMNMAVSACLAVYDLIGLFSSGFGSLSFTIILKYILAAVATFGSTLLGIRILKALANSGGYGFFVYYSWGAALFTFILNIMA